MEKFYEALFKGLATGLMLSILLAAYLILKKIILLIVKKFKEGKL
jgi:hypothetical protein